MGLQPEVARSVDNIAFGLAAIPVMTATALLGAADYKGKEQLLKFLAGPTASTAVDLGADTAKAVKGAVQSKAEKLLPPAQDLGRRVPVVGPWVNEALKPLPKKGW